MKRKIPPLSPVEPIQGKDDPKSLYFATRRFCRKRGLPVHDPEYDSAINGAVFTALSRWRENGGRKLIHLCIFYALRECRHVTRRLEAQHRHDLASAHRGIARPPTPPPVPLSDFEVLSFVAVHRVAKAARLLGMTAYKLKTLLCEIQLRVREGIALAPEPETYLLGDAEEWGEGMSYHPG